MKRINTSIKVIFAVVIIVLLSVVVIYASRDETIKLTILSTNDVHSNIDSYNNSTRLNYGKGGFALRSSIVKKIREENDNILLLDAGDFLQGTPYFNFFGGELEFKLMSEMAYDAVGLGNHEFDNGVEELSKHISSSDFPVINSNYDFSKTSLDKLVLPYLIVDKGPLKIGIIALGVKLSGLVGKSKYGDIVYQDPIKVANQYSTLLKEKGCDFVVCISHLGFDYDLGFVSDKELALKTRNIDYIVGGHTHTLIDTLVEISNLDNKKVVVSQAGSRGLNIAKVDFYFNRE